MIPPPRPNEKDYSTCEACRAHDTVSKKRKWEGTTKNPGKQHVPGPSVVGVEKSNQRREVDAERGCYKGEQTTAKDKVSGSAAILNIYY